jgi:hypothetical protein
MFHARARCVRRRADQRFDEPQVSPDGRSLAYVSNEPGQDEVYVEPFRRERDRARNSATGGGQPTTRLLAVQVRAAGERLQVSRPAELFEIRGLQGSGYDDYAWSADGQRFLVKLAIVRSPAWQPRVQRRVETTAGRWRDSGTSRAR